MTISCGLLPRVELWNHPLKTVKAQIHIQLVLHIIFYTFSYGFNFLLYTEAKKCLNRHNKNEFCPYTTAKVAVER